MNENKAASYKKIDLIFNPKSIAIIGASEKSLYGKGILEHLRHFGYSGRIYPVNPKRDQILGLQAYPNVAAISEEIDLAIIIVGRKYVLDSLKGCAAKKIPSVIIITAGFRESDEEGMQLEQEISKFAREKDLYIIGPNCAGLANIQEKIVMCLLREEGRELLPGNVGFVSQSGALMMALAGVARDRGIGLNYIVSCGNECSLEVSDFMKYMVENPNVKVITSFVEGFKNVSKFIEVADLAIENRKPIIVLKVGRSELGQKAAASHTAHLTGSDSAYDALFKQKGVIRAIDTYDLFEISKIFSPEKSPKGDGVLILTSSGGAGSLTADLCGDLGIKLPEITGPTLEKLLNIEGLLTFGKISNPADVRGQGMQIIDKVLPPLLQDDKYAVILICLAFSSVAPGLAQKIVPNIIALSEKTDKPIVVLWLGRKKMDGITDKECGFDVLEKNKIPVFEKPATCLRAIKHFIEWNKFIETQEKRIETPHSANQVARKKIEAILQAKGGPLNEFDSKRILSLYDIPITEEFLATSVNQAKSIAKDMNYPVVLKVMSDEIQHKTDAGIVALNIMDENELERHYNQILINAKKFNPDANIRGVLVQEFLREGTEIILGMSHDFQFGPLVMFGMGGIFVEVFKDVSFRVPPLNDDDAESMIRETKGFKILEGTRGKKRADIGTIIEILVKFSHLCLDLKDLVAELDINPLTVFEAGKGAKAVDALLIRK